MGRATRPTNMGTRICMCHFRNRTTGFQQSGSSHTSRQSHRHQMSRLHELCIICPTCGSCELWVLYECINCKKQLWVRSRFAQAWCESCTHQAFTEARQLAQLLIVTGHKPGFTPRYFEGEADLQRQVIEENRQFIIIQFECSKPLLVPYIWQISPECWEETKQKCAK